MRNFLRVCQGLDTFPILHALAAKSHLWNQNRLRKDYPGSPHKDVDDIWLWFNEIPADAPMSVVDDRDVIPYPAWMELPQTHGVVFDLMRRVGGVRLGRVIITRLASGKEIAPHEDMGAPATYYTRYQVILQGDDAVLKCGDEYVMTNTGDVWMFDNTKTHSVHNGGRQDRIVMIVDIRLGT